jgi:hypothetical protein
VADSRVEQQAEDLALVVVADRRRRRRDTGVAVVPDLARRLFQRLQQPSGRVLQLSDLRAFRREEFIARAKSGARHEQTAVVRRHAFRNP